MLAQQPKERAQTIKQPAAANPETDEFKNTLAAMLARGPGGRQNSVVHKPQQEESKQKIKLNVFEDDDEDEAERMKKMLERQSNLASEETEIKLGIPPPQKVRRLSKRMSVEFDDE